MIAGVIWRWVHQHTKASLVLKPSPADIHPFTIKFDLPPWNLAQDVDFRGWLFS